LPVVKELKANKMALFPNIPSDNIISTFLISSTGTSSGHPP